MDKENLDKTQENPGKDGEVVPAVRPEAETVTAEVPDAEQPVAAEGGATHPDMATEKNRRIIGKLKAFGGKKLLVSAVALLVVITIIAISSAAANSPTAMIMKGAKNTMHAFGKNETVSFLNGIVNGGSVELKSDLDELGNGELSYLGIDGDVSAKVHLNLKDNAAAFLLNADSMDLDMFLNKADFAVSSQELLGGSVYGVNLKNAGKNFKKSAFAPDGKYALGVESIDPYLEWLNNRDENTKNAEKLLRNIISTACRSLDRNAEMETHKETLNFGDEDIKTTVIDIELDREDVVYLVKDIVTALRKDAAFKKLLSDNAEALCLQYNDAYYKNYDSGEFVKEIFGSLEELADELDDVKEYAEQKLPKSYKAKATFYISKSGKYLVGMKLNINKSLQFSLLAGPSLDDLKELKVVADDGYSKYTLTYMVKENTGKDYHSTLTVKAYDRLVFRGQVRWDKRDGDLQMVFTDRYDNETTVDAEMMKKGKTLKIDLESVKEGRYEQEVNACLILSSSDRMPTVPKYNDLFKMDEDDITGILDDVEDFLARLYWVF